MKWHNLNLTAAPNTKRVGRGIGSGLGKTSGRGTKGQRARSGGSLRPGFEGGQNPLSQRLPKQRGFTSMAVPTQVVHTDQLNQFKAGSTVSFGELKAAGLLSSLQLPTKLLLRGKVQKALKVELSAISKSAQTALEAAGGSFKKVSLPKVHQKKNTGDGSAQP